MLQIVLASHTRIDAHFLHKFFRSLSEVYFLHGYAISICVKRIILLSSHRLVLAQKETAM